MIAASALLLASSLEVCGCDVAKDCEQIRAMQISAESWPRLLRRCAACLSSEEMKALAEEENRIAASSSGAMPETGETVGEALGEGPPLSFYEPGTALDEVSVAPQPESLSMKSSLSTGSRPRIWPISESVFFVYPDVESGRSAHAAPIATAFVVSVPSLDQRDRIRFLVTARHVVDPEWAHCSNRNPEYLVVRLNRWIGGSDRVRIPLETDRERDYFTPLDESADIAAIRLDDRVIPNIDSYRLRDMPYSLLPTAEELNRISKARGKNASFGDRQIVTAGLPMEPLAEDRSVAVSYSGVLTSTPAEPVSVRCGSESTPTPLRIWTIPNSGPAPAR